MFLGRETFIITGFLDIKKKEKRRNILTGIRASGCLEYGRSRVVKFDVSHRGKLNKQYKGPI